jgi:hypothetical protein
MIVINLKFWFWMSRFFPKSHPTNYVKPDITTTRQTLSDNASEAHPSCDVFSLTPSAVQTWQVTEKKF